MSAHLNALPQSATGQRSHRLSTGDGHCFNWSSDRPIVGELIRAAREAERGIACEVRAVEQTEILRALVQICTALNRSTRRAHANARTLLAPIAHEQIV